MNRKLTKEALESIVVSSFSIAEVIKRLNFKMGGGAYRYVKFNIKRFGLDMSHFRGKGWSKGLTKGVDKRVHRKQRPDEDIFIKDSPEIHGGRLRKRLLWLGWKYICYKCGQEPIWNNEPLTLHLDHKNGEPDDNRFENLRFLCPNCHQQTKSWGRRKDTQVGLR